jgi:hypothetical protein
MYCHALNLDESNNKGIKNNKNIEHQKKKENKIETDEQQKKIENQIGKKRKLEIQNQKKLEKKIKMENERRNRMNNHQNQIQRNLDINQINNINPNFFEPVHPNYEHPTDKTIINTLPENFIEDVEKLNNEKKNCLICLQNFRNGDKATYLPCFHFFHSNCVNDWLKTQNFCPICKFKLEKDKLII